MRSVGGRLACFKPYDIRGRVPDELDEDLAYSIGRAFAACFSPSRVAIGRDVRLSSPVLAEALAQGLASSGVSVLDLGMCGTEEASARCHSSMPPSKFMAGPRPESIWTSQA